VELSLRIINSLIAGRDVASTLGYSGCRYAGRKLASGTPRPRGLVAHAGDDTPVARRPGLVAVAPRVARVVAVRRDRRIKTCKRQSLNFGHAGIALGGSVQQEKSSTDERSLQVSPILAQ
jgi:hypothetical protein